MMTFDSPFLAGLIGKRVVVGEVGTGVSPWLGTLKECNLLGIVLDCPGVGGVLFIPWRQVTAIQPAEPK